MHRQCTSLSNRLKPSLPGGQQRGREAPASRQPRSHVPVRLLMPVWGQAVQWAALGLLCTSTAHMIAMTGGRLAWQACTSRGCAGVTCCQSRFEATVIS